MTDDAPAAEADSDAVEEAAEETPARDREEELPEGTEAPPETTEAAEGDEREDDEPERGAEGTESGPPRPEASSGRREQGSDVDGDGRPDPEADRAGGEPGTESGEAPGGSDADTHGGNDADARSGSNADADSGAHADREPGRNVDTERVSEVGGEVSRARSGDAEGGAADGSRPEIAAPDADTELQSVPAPPDGDASEAPDETDDVPEDVRSYDRFQKVDRARYDRVNEFLRDRTYVTAREWAIARLCADFRTATGVEMTKIGQHLPELVPFMTDTYSPQAVNQARSAFEEKVQMAGATFLYGAMSGFFTADELDDLMYEVTEVAKFLLEVEGVELTVEEELDAEDRISAVMREVRQASEELRYDEVACPHCGQAFQPDVGED